MRTRHKQRVATDLETHAVSNNTTGTLEQKKTNGWTPEGQATDKKAPARTEIVGIPMGTNCAPLLVDLFLLCYERDFMTSHSDVKQVEIIETFKSISSYLDDLLNIDNPCFEGMVNSIYPPELQLNKTNTTDTKAPFFFFFFCIYLFQTACFIWNLW